MDTFKDLFWSLALLGAMVFAFLPSIQAFRNHHRRRWFIFGVNVALGAFGVGTIAGWWLYYSAKPFAETGLAPVTAEPHRCPSCDRFYDPADYRADASEIFCSYCGGRLPQA